MSSRRTVQTIWANCAVRRANKAAQSGNVRLSLAILNAAAAWFPDNVAVSKALASGYAASWVAEAGGCDFQGAGHDDSVSG